MSIQYCIALRQRGLGGVQEGAAEAEDEEDEADAALEERDAETFDDSEFYQQLLKEFLEGSAVGSGGGALAASAGVSDWMQNPCRQSQSMLKGPPRKCRMQHVASNVKMHAEVVHAPVYCMLLTQQADLSMFAPHNFLTFWTRSARSLSAHCDTQGK